MRSKKGFALVLSVVTTLIIFALVESFFASLISHINLISVQNDRIRAYNMAEAGLAVGIINLRAGNNADINTTTLANGSYAVRLLTTGPHPPAIQ